MMKGDTFRVKCPICHALPGGKCRDLHGHPMRKPHEKRRQLVSCSTLARAFREGRVDHLMARARRGLPLDDSGPPPDLT